MHKITYLEKDLQKQIVEVQLSKIFTQNNLDQNVVIEFLTTNYQFKQLEKKKYVPAQK